MSKKGTDGLGFDQSNLPVKRFPGRDGQQLTYREIGDGRPIILLHGFTGNAMQLIQHGPACAIASNGYHVILPDLRGHGNSACPRDRAFYPPDILADDGIALINWLGVEDYDLGGYSLGGRIALRMLVRGARPSHAIVAGQGLDAVKRATSRSSLYYRVLTALANRKIIEPGSPDAVLAYWIKQSGGDPRALCNVLESLVATPDTALCKVMTPTLVVIGDQDSDHVSADALAAVLPNSKFQRVPGNHFTALTRLELAKAILDFVHDWPHKTA